ncbi:NAD(P)/FAD-dependent oxidoreductase [Eubacteriales bacterium OttesenSCG-928-M02]|nr:NAD(P)/FAD-dependent oxidoreductase [Eubacteriales bacterium OttesenSCG-928-M02]
MAKWHGLTKALTPENVLVIDGGLIGCELALDLANEKKDVPIVEILPDILSAGDVVPFMNGMMLRDLLADRGVAILAGHSITQVKPGAALIAHWW